MWIAIATQPWCPEWQAPLVASAATITPAMVWREHVLLLDVRASLQWLGGVRGLKHQVQRELSILGINGHVAMAHSALGAWLLTVCHEQRPTGWLWVYALSPRRLYQRLNSVAMLNLPEVRPYLQWFAHLGCHTLGDLRALDRSELLARTNRDLLKALDQAYGQAVFAYEALTLPMQFRQQLELPRLVKDTAGLEPYIKRLLQALCGWLKANRLAVCRLEYRLHHRDRQRARQPTVIMLSIAQPSDEQSVLWRWLSVRLERVALPAPVSDIALMTRTLNTREDRNLQLFDDDKEAHTNISQTLDLLRARLGQASVKQAQLTSDHRPEVANAWIALNDSLVIGAKGATTHSEMSRPMDCGAHCPSWLLPEPKALQTHQDQPQLQGPLRLLQGPWRLETGWWDHGLAARDYFVATDQSARRYWIYRERGHHTAHWFLHGLFG